MFCRCRISALSRASSRRSTTADTAWSPRKRSSSASANRPPMAKVGVIQDRFTCFGVHGADRCRETNQCPNGNPACRRRLRQGIEDPWATRVSNGSDMTNDVSGGGLSMTRPQRAGARRGHLSGLPRGRRLLPPQGRARSDAMRRGRPASLRPSARRYRTALRRAKKP